MSIKDRINMIKSKRQQIEALLSAKEKEIEEEYQMVMELYSGVSERVEEIKTKQKQTEETLDKYDSLLAFLNDDLPTEEEPTVNEPAKEESKLDEDLLNQVEDTEDETSDSSEDIDALIKLTEPPKEEQKEVKFDSKWKVAVEKATEEDEVNSLLDQIGAS